MENSEITCALTRWVSQQHLEPARGIYVRAASARVFYLAEFETSCLLDPIPKISASEFKKGAPD